MTTPIHLDHNATTPPAPEVLEAKLPYLREQFGNPCSSYRSGRFAADEVSGVLAARGIDASRAAGAVRLSAGPGTAAEDVAPAADAMVAAWQRMSTR